MNTGGATVNRGEIVSMYAGLKQPYINIIIGMDHFISAISLL